MGRFTQYLGKTEVMIDGELHQLDVKLKDKEQFMKTQSMKDEKKVETITQVLIEIIKRSYPEEPANEVEAFVEKNYVEYLENLTIAFGWAKKEDFDNLKKKQMEKVNS